jgi:chitinase
MKKQYKDLTAGSMEPKRRLSPLRVILALVMLAGISYGVFWGWHRLEETRAVAPIKPWFASYVDVTATPRYAFEQLGTKVNQKNLILSFVVSSKEDPCTPSWGGVYTFPDAEIKLDLDRRIARLRQQGGNVAVSFGGLLNDELALNCKDSDMLLKAYKEVVDRYDIDTIDFDLEGAGLINTEALRRRALVLTDLQKMYRSENKRFALWLTLPVTPFGLAQDGINAVSEMLSNGVDLAGVNVMTMDYGSSRASSQSMQQASERALIETHRQLGILFKKYGINLSDVSLWEKMGATPMIGQNDVAGEIFTLEDAAGLNKFAISKSISRMSMWSANRDIECGENYVNIQIVSDSCSGVKQSRFGFAAVLGLGFDGDMSSNASRVIAQSPETKQKPDDPEQSPYQIWSESATYLEGTKVVWHQNVYQAKWWTRGDLPDNPVLQAWETPWQLIGPVLPGEKPIPQPTLPPGTYPEWSGSAVYDEGQRVLFNGVPYEARWWTQGDSPAASASNPDSSPWIILTQKQIDEITKQRSNGHD